MTITELHNLRYKLMDKASSLIYISSTQKLNLIKRIVIKVNLKVLFFRINRLYKQIHI